MLRFSPRQCGLRFRRPFTSQERIVGFARKHTIKLWALGVAGGAFVTYYFISKNPGSLEKWMARSADTAFSAALNFESRSDIYLRLPEYSLPPQLFVPATDIGVSTTSLLAEWANKVHSLAQLASSSFLLQTKLSMRESLLEEILKLPDLEVRLAGIRKVLPPSLERNILTDMELSKEQWVPTSLFKEGQWQDPAETCDMRAKFLTGIMAKFPGPMNQLALLLQDEVNLEDPDNPVRHFAHALARGDTQLEESLAEAVSYVSSQFHLLLPPVREYVLQHAFEDAIKFCLATEENAIRLASSPPSPAQLSSLSSLPLSSPVDTPTLSSSPSLVDTASPPSSSDASSSSSLTPTTPHSVAYRRLTTVKSAFNIPFLHLLPPLQSVQEEPPVPVLPSLSPYELYLVALDDYLLAPLAKDTRIPRDLLTQVKLVFLALPPASQARVLLSATLHPYAGSLVPREQASLVKDLMASGGIVAIKLAQMLAENPAVPKDYRELFGSLRAGNAPMSLGAFWSRIPTALHARISHLGPRLGTGSVKQVNRARWIHADGALEEVAVGVLRSNVEDEALSSIDALGKSPEIAQLASRLGVLVYRELDLFTEGQTLREFADTNIGKHPLFHVVDVIHHSPKCLVEEVATGRTLAAILEPQNAGLDEYKLTTRLLADYHRVVFHSFAKDGLIHSDIHLGNACLNGTRTGLTLFDIGQFERITLPETTALLWTLATVSTVQRRKQMRSICLKHLKNVSRISRADPTWRNSPRKKSSSSLEELLSRSFDEAIAPKMVVQPDGSVEEEIPDKKEAYLNLLRACELNGVALPKGSFALAKMLDAMTSQQEDFALPAVMEDSTEKFLRAHITWREKLTILLS